MVTKKDTPKKTATTAKKTTTSKAAPKKAAEKSATKAASSKKPKTAKNPSIAHGVGRRKSAVARVWVRKGQGALRVNDRYFTEYFDTDTTRIDAYEPFSIAPQLKQSYEVDVTVNGGGLHAQSGATKLAIARAVVSLDESLRTVMREHGLLTVDSRVKERKKYGQKAARRKFQFVKR